MYRQKVAGR